MDENRERLMREIMAADFSIIDLNLYLDTHPNDLRAIMLRNNFINRSVSLRYEYERLYGPINAQLSPSSCPWQWIKSPWPWE